MFIKPFENPIELAQLEALNLRTPDHHPQKQQISSNFYKMLAGVAGEREVSYQLQFLPKNDYYIFHNLRLFVQNNHFQIDFLIVTQYFIAILEVKNLKGLIYFNELEQLHHQKERNKVEVYDNPVSQVERHKIQLQTWLYQNGYFDIPIIPLVVLSSSTRLIHQEKVSKSILNKIVSVSNIYKIITNLNDKYSNIVLTKKSIPKLSKAIISSHSPLTRDLLTQHNIHVSDLIKGVSCPNCSNLPMIKIHGGWRCPKCQFTDKFAYIYSLNDYYLLVDDTITNKEARNFLLIEDENIMYQLLVKAKYKAIGNFRYRKYILEYRNKKSSDNDNISKNTS